MTIQEIYEQVLLDVPKIAMRNFIKRYNEVVGILSNIYDVANTVKTDYIDATDREQTWYPLPVDCKGVNRVTAENGKELRSYKCEKGQICFGFTGAFKIEYIGAPSKLVRFSNEPPMQTGINDLFHLAIVKYILAHELPERFQFYMDMYTELSSKADERLRNVKRKNMRIATPKWR